MLTMRTGRLPQSPPSSAIPRAPEGSSPSKARPAYVAKTRTDRLQTIYLYNLVFEHLGPAACGALTALSREFRDHPHSSARILRAYTNFDQDIEDQQWRNLPRMYDSPTEMSLSSSLVAPPLSGILPPWPSDTDTSSDDTGHDFMDDSSWSTGEMESGSDDEAIWELPTQPLLNTSIRWTSNDAAVHAHDTGKFWEKVANILSDRVPARWLRALSQSTRDRLLDTVICISRSDIPITAEIIWNLITRLGARVNAFTLLEVVKRQRHDVAHMLLGSGRISLRKDTTGQGGLLGATLLQMAIFLGDVKMLRILLSHGAQGDTVLVAGEIGGEAITPYSLAKLHLPEAAVLLELHHSPASNTPPASTAPV